MKLRIFPENDTIVVDSTKRLTAVDIETDSPVSGHWYINGRYSDDPDNENLKGTFSDGIALIKDDGEYAFELHGTSTVTLKGLSMEPEEDTFLQVSSEKITSNPEAENGDSGYDSYFYYSLPSVYASKAIISPASAYNVRMSAGTESEIIGKLNYREIRVSITERDVKRDGENIWFKVRFSEMDFAHFDVYKKVRWQMGGPEGWIRSDAFIGGTCILPWKEFLKQVRTLDNTFENKNLLERITRLRQLGHNESLPFDQVITTGGNLSKPIYRDKLSLSDFGWKIFLESQACEMPNGEIIDMYHFMVGLDVLQSAIRRENHHIDIKVGSGVVQNIPVGQNYSVATWAGDIGAAVADFAVKKSFCWENFEERTENDRLHFYFYTRANESDLLGNIDAWAATIDFVDNATDDSLEKVLTAQYGDGLEAPAVYNERIGHRRKRTLIFFLNDYQFTRVTSLKFQEAADNIIRQIHIFSRLWAIFNLRSGDIAESPVLRTISEKMSDIFLDWLEKKASFYGVMDEDLTA